MLYASKLRGVSTRQSMNVSCRRQNPHVKSCKSRALSSLDASLEPLAGTTPGSSIPWLFIAQVALGLPTALWAYKCLVLVIAQRKIIYLPYVPLGSRTQTLQDYRNAPQTARELSKLVCHKITAPSNAPTRWLRRPVTLQGLQVSYETTAERDPDLVVVYLQGNAGTPLVRMPVFRRILSRPQQQKASSERHGASVTIQAFAPRSYWLSTRATPTEHGILNDFAAAVRYARTRFPDANIVIYGHSLGAAAAIKLALEDVDLRRTVKGFIIENPLPSIPFMVRALYPQKWLPYHYLGRFAFDRWDARGALAAANADNLPPSLWIRSGRDEIIPAATSDGTDAVASMFADWQRCSPPQSRSTWLQVKDALHDNAFESRSWSDHVDIFLESIAQGSKIINKHV
ncbi:hypothetical protein ACM66B_006422 [Microbotryomycetes sp. NB124-2]